MPQSKVIQSVGIDFVSQVSDLRKREKELAVHLFFRSEFGTEEYTRTRKELGRTRNALSCIEGLEVTPD